MTLHHFKIYDFVPQFLNKNDVIKTALFVCLEDTESDTAIANSSIKEIIIFLPGKLNTLK